MTLNRPVRWTLLVALGPVVALILGLLPGGVELSIVAPRTGETLLVAPLEPGERWTLHYIHSVELAPIWEEHSLDAEGAIYVEEERYLKFGAGMGRIPGRGRLARRGKYEVIEDMHTPTGEFILRVGTRGIVDHTIWWRGTKTNLSEAAAHQPVRFRGRQVSLLNKFFRTLFPHPKTPTNTG